MSVVAAEPARAGHWVSRFYASTIGRKIVMAITGIVLVGFITVHMAGNLLAFDGRAALDEYSAFLQGNRPLLWTVRLVIFLSLVFHLHAAWSLTRRSRAARPDRYARLEPRSATWAARLMRVGGVILTVFVVFHILHFTTGTVLPSQFVAGAVYDNVVRSFSIGWVAVFYLVAMAALALHLQHGVWSAFQTLGVTHPHVDPARRRLAWLLSVVIPVGFAAVPLAVVFRLMR